MAGYQTGVNSFSLDLSRFAQKAEVEIKTVVQKISMEAFKRIILKSPVDTGRFRANWGVTIGQPRTGVTNATDKSGSSTQAAMVAGVTGWNGDKSIFMVNNLPYSIALEYGHSKQAPGGMVRTTMAEMGAVVKGAVK